MKEERLRTTGMLQYPDALVLLPTTESALYACRRLALATGSEALRKLLSRLGGCLLARHSRASARRILRPAAIGSY